jgi:hypothetical protein
VVHCQKGGCIGIKKILEYPKVFLLIVVKVIGCLNINKMRKIDSLEPDQKAKLQFESLLSSVSDYHLLYKRDIITNKFR